MIRIENTPRTLSDAGFFSPPASIALRDKVLVRLDLAYQTSLIDLQACNLARVLSGPAQLMRLTPVHHPVTILKAAPIFLAHLSRRESSKPWAKISGAVTKTRAGPIQRGWSRNGVSPGRPHQPGWLRTSALLSSIHRRDVGQDTAWVKSQDGTQLRTDGRATPVTGSYLIC